MKLSVFERVILLDILPKEGDFQTIKILSELREALSFSEQEYKVCEIRFEGGHVFWNEATATKKDIKIKDKATEIIVNALKDLDAKKKITDGCLSLYEKFIKETGND